MRRFLVTLLCLSPWLAQSQLESTSDLQRSLVGWWRFNEGTGTNAFDLSGNANTGTLSGSTLPVWTNGVFGGALSFDGSHAYVAMPNSAADITTNDYSVCLWLATTNTAGTIISKGNPQDSGGTGYAIELGGTVLDVVINAGSGTKVVVRKSGVTTVTNGKWHFLACSMVRTGNGILYIDGASASTAVISSKSGTISNATQLKIANGVSGLFSGSIDDVRIYSRALSDTEVLNLYCQGGGRTP